MPTYEYLCTKCNERSESVQSFSDKPLVKCKSCGGKLKKLFGSVGVVFKGPGFYRTDSRPAKSSSSSASDRSSGSDSGPSTSKESSSSGSSGSTESASPSPATEKSTAKPKTETKSKTA